MFVAQKGAGFNEWLRRQRLLSSGVHPRALEAVFFPQSLQDALTLSLPCHPYALPHAR